MDPWSKGDYSRHIREVSMEVDGHPEVVPPSGRVSGQFLLAAPILKRRRQQYREEFGNNRSILGVSSAGAKYRPKGAPRGATRQPGGQVARPRGGAPGTLLGPWWVHSLPSLVLREASGMQIFYIIFLEIYWTLLMAGKPEIQKQQKTGTGNWL